MRLLKSSLLFWLGASVLWGQCKLVYNPTTAHLDCIWPIASSATNGIIYWDGTKLTSTATGGAGTLCLVSTAGGTPTFSACSGSAATAWSSLTSPSVDTSISMLTHATTFTTGTGTATANIWTFQDTTGNTGTGSLFNIATVGTSTMLPLTVTAGGTANGVQMNASAVLAPIGTGTIQATSLIGANPSIAGHPVIEGVTSTGHTGSGGIVFSASPTFTGTVTAPTLNLTSGLTLPITGSTQCLHADTAGVVTGTGSDCGSGGTTSLSGITAASGAHTINNGDNAQIWNWSLTTASKSGFSFGENVASVATGTPVLLNINTLASSTANPFQVTAGGTANGVRVDTSGALSAIGTGHVNADELTGTPLANLATGLVKVTNGTGAVSTAVAKTDYAPATTGNVPLAGDNAGGFTPATQTMVAALWAGANCGTGTNYLLVNGTCGVPGGQAGQYTSVTFSATPTFTASSNTVNSWAITLTGNVTSSTLASANAGDILNFKICQDATGSRTFAWPTGFTLAATISPIASACTKQSFFWDGSVAVPVANATVDSGPAILTETAAPAGNPASGAEYSWSDSTDKIVKQKDSSGNVNAMVRTAASGTSHQWVDYVASTGIPHTSQPSIADLTAQAANTIVMNATAGSAVPTAVAAPAGGTNGCAGATDAAIYTAGTGWGCHQITAGATTWNTIGSPGGNLALTMAADTSTFTYNATTGAAADLFVLKDTLNNTGTGNLLRVTTASGSAAHPVEFDVNGNGVQMSTAGVLAAVGTGHNNADWLNGAAATGANGNLASWGASNALGDSSVVAANVVTAGANFTSGNLVQAAGNNKTTSDSGIAAANVPTMSANATAAKQIIVSGSTNKTQTAIDFPEVLVIPAANCNNATGGAGWNIPATNAPTVACRAGTNNLDGVLQWANNNTTTNAQFELELPGDWDSSTQPYINIFYGSGANTAGTVKWTFSTACTKADGSITDDPAFNAETATTGKTMAVANRMWAESLQFTAVTSLNNCVPGGVMFVKITSGNGTATSSVNVYKATLTIPRLLTVQAN